MERHIRLLSPPAVSWRTVLGANGGSSIRRIVFYLLYFAIGA